MFPFQTHPKQASFAKTVFDALKNTYDGKDAPQESPFSNRIFVRLHLKILAATSLIPTGYATSHGAIAKAAGGAGAQEAWEELFFPTLSRLLLPARVVSSDFTLGGYGGGLAAKLKFLIREKRGYKSPRGISVGSRKLQVFPIERVLRKLGKE